LDARPRWAASRTIRTFNPPPRTATARQSKTMAKKMMPMPKGKAMKAFEKADKKSDAKEMKMAMKKAGKKNK
jgi:hypothetical protein